MAVTMNCDRCGNLVPPGDDKAGRKTGRLRLTRGNEEITRLDLCGRCRALLLETISAFLKEGARGRRSALSSGTPEPEPENAQD